MKKFLAIIMAVLMLASGAVTAVSAAEDTINYEEFYNENGINPNLKIFAVKDEFISHATTDEQLKINDITEENIIYSINN